MVYTYSDMSEINSMQANKKKQQRKQKRELKSIYAEDPDDFLKPKWQRDEIKRKKATKKSAKRTKNKPYKKQQKRIVGSEGEQIVARYLIDSKIPFKREYDTLRCISPRTGYQLPYDFELYVNKIIIEIQGSQHYDKSWYKTEEEFEIRKYNDKIKREFAIKKGYTFIALQYSEIYNGSFEFRIKQAIIARHR